MLLAACLPGDSVLMRVFPTRCWFQKWTVAEVPPVHSGLKLNWKGLSAGQGPQIVTSPRGKPDSLL